MGLFIPGCILTLVFASMDNHRYNQKEFNDLFFSTLSLSYLGANVGFTFLGLLLSYFILKAHPTIINPKKELSDTSSEGEGCDDALLDETYNTSIGDHRSDISHVHRLIKNDKDEEVKELIDVSFLEPKMLNKST